MRLRQIALVARHLDPVVEDLREVFGLGPGFADPGVGVFGLHNAVLPVGDTFLEVVSPLAPGPETAGGRFLERRGGDGGYMVILQVGPDPERLEAVRAAAERAGVRRVWDIDTEAARAFHLHPRDTGGAILSFDWMADEADWVWAGPAWRGNVRRERTRSIRGCAIAAADPAGACALWGALCGIPPDPDGQALLLDDGTRVRFLPPDPDRGPGLAEVDLAVADRAAVLAAARDRGLSAGPDQVLLCGTRCNFVDP